MFSLHPFSANAAPNQAHLRILETTDLHAHILPYDYYADKESDAVGLVRTATLIHQARGEATNSLLADNGDFLQGSPIGDYAASLHGLDKGEVHPVIEAMNALEFDAGTLGNHEFNYGLDFLMAALGGARFPIVCANIARAMSANPVKDETLVPPYVLLDRELTNGAAGKHPIRIGLIGLVPPQVMNWDRSFLQGRVDARDMVNTAKAYLPEMQAEGADIIIALAHTGIGAAEHTEGMENAAIPLAALEGIDVVLTGHSHSVFPSEVFAELSGVDAKQGRLHGKPAVMAGAWGSHLGVVDLLLEREADTWRLQTASSETRPIVSAEGPVASDPALNAQMQPAHTSTLASVRAPVGKSKAALHSYFSLVANDRSVQLVARAQHWFVQEALKGTHWEDLPLVSAAAPFKAGGQAGPGFYTDVAAGDLALRNIADLYIYPNSARAVEVTGRELANWLERSASIFNQVEPGAQDAPLQSIAFPCYNFDMILGLTYQIDLSQPPKFNVNGSIAHASSQRITDLQLDGAPIAPEDRLIVATNSYRTGGGGSFPGALHDKIIYEAPVTNRDVLLRYVTERGTVEGELEPNWSFAPLSETSVTFETGPKRSTIWTISAHYGLSIWAKAHAGSPAFVYCSNAGLSCLARVTSS